MFRVWFKIYKENHLIKDTIVESNDYDISRTKKVFDALENACHEFDLSIPIWLNLNVNDFKRHSRTRFNKDNFIEEIDFDYLEMQVIEEEY